MAKETTPAARAAEDTAYNNRSVLSGAHDYFVNNVLPDEIKACVRRIKSPTLYISNHDETFILVRSGKGRLMVNGLEYRLCAGTLINLGPFHRYRYIPDGGELEVVEARTNPGTYVYMIANPYLRLEQFSVPSKPPVVYLKGLYADIANESMNGILAEMEKKSPDRTGLCFCYLTDLFGLITEKLSKTCPRSSPDSPKSQSE